jgi:hypothetical protein
VDLRQHSIDEIPLHAGIMQISLSSRCVSHRKQDSLRWDAMAHKRKFARRRRCAYGIDIKTGGRGVEAAKYLHSEIF